MENKENTEVSVKKEESKIASNWRKIVIETDGNSIRLSSAEVAGNLELIAILKALLNKIDKYGN